jgi:hypothetical protein
MGIELPHEYKPSADEEFMSPMQVEYFSPTVGAVAGGPATGAQRGLATGGSRYHPGGRPDRPCQCCLGTRICAPEPRTDPEIATANGTSAFKA